MDFSTITAVPQIAIICAMIFKLYKTFTPEPYHKHIPALCGLLGAILGALSFCSNWADIHTESLYMALAIGAVSGWAATAVHQVYKQYFGGNE